MFFRRVVKSLLYPAGRLMSFFRRIVRSLYYLAIDLYLHIRYLNKPAIPYMETHVCDHCNLNCKSCAFLTSLVTEPVFTDLGEYTKDMQTLSKKLAIRTIRIMGGEPLLHPQVSDFVRVTREAFPQSKIFIVTNGLLLLKMPEVFWETLRKYKVRINWSKYPPLKDRFAEIYECIRKHGALLGFKDTLMLNDCIESFHNWSVFSPDKTEDPKLAYSRCTSNHCVSLHRGKLYTCPAYSVFRANDYFKADHEVPEGWDINRYSGRELRNFLNKPIPFCSYCHHAVHPKTFPWDVSERKPDEWM